MQIGRNSKSFAEPGRDGKRTKKQSDGESYNKQQKNNIINRYRNAAEH